MKAQRILLILIILITGMTTSGKGVQKYALSLFHFNLQYVAGDYRIENRIIRESLYPVLQFFEQHPNYKSDIEIQGYAIEVLAEEHPQVLALLKKLVDRDQIELVIAHYSDQFFIAYPALDLQRSIEISDEVLAQNNLQRSKVFFGQEIQWSPGLASALKGKYQVVVTSAHPHGYYRGKTLPLVNVRYGNDAILAFIGGGEKRVGNVKWTWAFLDDGEVFNTRDYNSNFYRVPEQEKENIEHFKKLEQEGYQFVKISELVDILKRDPEYKIPDYPFVPEGTWNMQVGGPFLWMGKQRSGVETDGITRALCYQVRGFVLLAEKLIAYAEKQGADVSQLKKMIKQAWRHLLLSEVSDSSGWTPWLIEVRYTDNEAENAMMILRKIFDELKKYLPSQQEPVLVDTNNGNVKVVNRSTISKSQPAHLPLFYSVRAEKFTVQNKQVNDDLYRMDIECQRPKDGAVEIAFQTAGKGLKYSASCGESTIVEIPTDLKHDPILALSNGFLYLGNGYSLIKDCTVEHLAATWKMKEQRVIFREELNEKNPAMRMRFYILKGSPQQGLDLANRLNTSPAYIINLINGHFEASRLLPEMMIN